MAVLKHREESVLEFFRTAMERHGKRTKEKLQAFFAALKEWFLTPDFRGCAFINAAVELADPKHPGSKFVREHKERFREMIDGLVEEAVGKCSHQAHPSGSDPCGRGGRDRCHPRIGGCGRCGP